MKVAVHTSGRQDWGILRPVCRAIAASKTLRLTLAAGSGHRLRSSDGPVGLDGFEVRAQLHDRPFNDSAHEVARAAGFTTQGVAGWLEQDQAECLVVCGDRLESLAACIAATAMRIPICHLHGGETTLGAIDNGIRHAITRLASLHCVSHPDYASRLVGMGVPPYRMWWTGAPALDDLMACRLPTADRLCRRFSLSWPLILVCHHPTTLGDTAAEAAATFNGVRAAVDAYKAATGRDCTVIVSEPNMDVGRDIITGMIPAEFALTQNLGSDWWWGLMSLADALVGNSSSGLIEAPCFGLPVINVGRRQEGRKQIGDVFNANTAEQVQALLRPLLRNDASPTPRVRRHTEFCHEEGASNLIRRALEGMAGMLPDQRIAVAP